MHRHHHLFERIGTLENLIAAAHEALRGKRMRKPGAGFLADFEKEVCGLHEELWAGTYRHGGYHYFTIHEPKERVVAAAPFRDRVVHHAIVRVIEPIFEQRFIEDSFACRTGKGTPYSLLPVRLRRQTAAHWAKRLPPRKCSWPLRRHPHRIIGIFCFWGRLPAGTAQRRVPTT